MLQRAMLCDDDATIGEGNRREERMRTPDLCASQTTLKN